MHTEGGAHTRRNTQKAACGHRRSLVIEGAIGKAVHTEGGTHKRRSVATAGVMLFKGGAGAGPRVERSEPKVGGEVGGGGVGGV